MMHITTPPSSTFHTRAPRDAATPFPSTAVSSEQRRHDDYALVTRRRFRHDAAMPLRLCHSRLAFRAGARRRVAAAIRDGARQRHSFTLQKWPWFHRRCCRADWPPILRAGAMPFLRHESFDGIAMTRLCSARKAMSARQNT